MRHRLSKFRGGKHLQTGGEGREREEVNWERPAADGAGGT